MKIAIVSGSSRKDSESLRVAKYLAERIDLETDLISLEGNPLDLWSDEVYSSEAFLGLQKRMADADAYVIVSPEWAGMVPSALKNLLLLMGIKEVGHKPALICGVSAGLNGAYPVAELKAFSNKNNFLVYIPDTIVLKDVTNLLKGGENEPKDLLERIDHALESLQLYAETFKVYREKRGEKLFTYMNGH